MTSRDVVNVVQRRVRPIKVGHAGTLDPLAKGVLVLGVGPAVRLVPYVQQLPKHYQATFRLGQSSVSGDLEGEVLQHPELPLPSLDQLQTASVQLTGTIEQIPPAHSAIWVDGKRAYKRVRAGEQVEMPSRTVRVESLVILSYDYPELELDIVCGSGTYIRTLGIDLAKQAGSTAVMAYLQRTGVGDFRVEDAITIDQLREEPLESMLLPAVRSVPHLPRLEIDAEQSIRLGHGLCIDGEPIGDRAATQIDEAAAVVQDDHLRAIVRRKRGQWYPYRVFPVAAPSRQMPPDL
jgi:tRNA pseudouridine55 synthase